MSRTGAIYMLVNDINGKKYIGQTVDIHRRINEHKLDNRQVIDCAIDKYGWANFTVIILEASIVQEKLNSKEMKYIEKYNTFKGRGYNCTEGGDSLGSGEAHPRYGGDMPEETKRKISEAHKGKVVPENVRKKMSKAKSGKNNPWYGVHRTGKDNPMYGKNHTEESKQKMRDNRGDLSGANNPHCKISREEGQEIKQKYDTNDNLRLQDLADKHDIGTTTVGKIVNKKHWATRDDNNE